MQNIQDKLRAWGIWWSLFSMTGIYHSRCAMPLGTVPWSRGQAPLCSFRRALQTHFSDFRGEKSRLTKIICLVHLGEYAFRFLWKGPLSLNATMWGLGNYSTLQGRSFGQCKDQSPSQDFAIACRGARCTLQLTRILQPMFQCHHFKRFKCVKMSSWAFSCSLFLLALLNVAEFSAEWTKADLRN